MTRHHQEFTCVHPSGLPLACNSRMERESLGVYPSAWHPAVTRDAPQGGDEHLSTGSELTLRHQSNLLQATHSAHGASCRTYVFALGRERVLPEILGRTSPRTSSPKLGSLIQTGFGLAVIVVYAAAGWDPVVHLFFWGGTTGGLGVLAA